MYTYTVTCDGQQMAQFTDQLNDFEVFGWMLEHNSSSVHRALTVEGWKITVTDQSTGNQFDYMDSSHAYASPNNRLCS